MPTNEERREVARRLRRISEKYDGVASMIVERHLGLESDDKFVLGSVFTSKSVKGLADLIEPEPDRTCAIDFADEDGFYLSCGHVVEGNIRPSYCSSCGARVAE